ncbi:MAG: sulfotransferase [Phenylobacterium sp.]|nr:sulfotransferase domain-containing protein [Phenylobacterium sp.]MDP2213492.1 sulfotransferase [Phenylobacterium sp.]
MSTLRGIFPNTFIIGAPKCGTSALATYISEHPNVFFSTPKEPFFWCSDFPNIKHEMSLDSLGDYLELFRKADPDMHCVVAEGSTRYLRSSVAINNILEFNPAAKFIAMVRNPVELVRAYHMEQRYSLHEDLADFEDAWRAQGIRSEGLQIPRGCREPAFLQYGQVASLGAQIEFASAAIPKDQLLVIVFDDFKSDPAEVYARTLGFLGLPNDGRAEFPVVNSAHGHRAEWLARLVLTPPAFLERPMLKARRHLWERRYPPIELVKGWLNRKQSRPEISPNLLLELKNYFREDVQRLGRAIHRDLSEWTR